jgi:Holliday junction resolvase RusA-like endonuclease
VNVVAWLESWIARLYASRHPSRAQFYVDGAPKTKGSLRWLPNRGPIENTRGSTAWKNRMAWMAKSAGIRRLERERPVSIICQFALPRPKSQLRGDGTLKADAPRWPTRERTGDLDKLLRNVFDALKNIAWADDAQVCEVAARKVFADGNTPPGVHVFLEDLED